MYASAARRLRRFNMRAILYAKEKFAIYSNACVYACWRGYDGFDSFYHTAGKLETVGTVWQGTSIISDYPKHPSKR